jgi:uncharacterized protein DUF5615
LKFKVDENLPTEYASILRGAGFEADTVSDEKLSGASDSVLSERCCTEDRVLSWDAGRKTTIPGWDFGGYAWTFAKSKSNEPTLVALLKRLVPVLLQLSPRHQLWIVEPDRIRYREE